MQAELASGKDLNTFKGPNTQVQAKCSLSKQIVSLLLLLLLLLLPSGVVSGKGDLLTPGRNQRG